jgi:hypothetical protein
MMNLLNQLSRKECSAPMNNKLWEQVEVDEYGSKKKLSPQVVIPVSFHPVDESNSHTPHISLPFVMMRPLIYKCNNNLR